MLDFNLLTGILVAVAIILFIRIGIPYLKKMGYKDIYTDVKMALLLFGYAFREDKVKTITNIILGIVNETEKLDIAPEEKKEEAVEVAFRKIIEILELEIDEEAIATIINIAVAYLPPTHESKEVALE